MEKVTGLDRRRKFPLYHRKTFFKWFKEHKSKGDFQVAYFVDLFANLNDPALGKAVVKILELNGAEVLLPKQDHSGMPLLSYGFVEKAKETMQFNVESLAEHVRSGCIIVASEPTAAFCIKKLYPEFLKTEMARRVASNIFEFFDFLSLLEEKRQLRISIDPIGKGKRVAYHAPCHTRSLLPNLPALRFLNKMGFDVVPVDTGCCGMAGTFGFKRGAEGYDLSMEIGRSLFEEVAKLGIDMVVTESSVCKMQLESGISVPVVSPVKLLLQACNGSLAN